MPFDGIGLDFIEGKKTASLIEAYGFPQDKQLFAGLINGKNIWKNHYEPTLRMIKMLQAKSIQCVLSTSCSLLHVPYTLKHEHMLSKHYTSYFAFAEEKLDELAQLKELAQCEDYHVASSYQANTKLFAQARDCVNEDVHQRLSRITEDDYIRKPSRNKRQVLQKQKLALPEFPTTTIGSFPQTNDVKVKRSTYRKGEVSETEYRSLSKRKLRSASDGRKKSDWTCWFTENMNETIWWSILAKH